MAADVLPVLAESTASEFAGLTGDAHLKNFGMVYDEVSPFYVLAPKGLYPPKTARS